MKSFRAFIGAGVLFFTLISVSCSSTKAAGLQQSENTKNKTHTYTFIMYDNCPEETSALSAKVSLMATIADYDGTYTYTFNKPSEKNASALSTYISACRQIQSYIEKGTNTPCTVIFSLSPELPEFPNDGLDFSSTKSALEEIKNLIQQDESILEYRVYAFYTKS